MGKVVLWFFVGFMVALVLLGVVTGGELFDWFHDKILVPLGEAITSLPGLNTIIK